MQASTINKKPVVSPDKRYKILDATIKRYQYQQDALIEVLHKAQGLFGCLNDDLLRYVAHSLKLPPSRVYGVATFYHLFSLTPKGLHQCVVCLGTACYVKGAAAVLGALEQQTHIHAGETTADGTLSLLTARCIGACSLAPVVVFDGAVTGYQTPELAREHLQEVLETPAPIPVLD